MNGEPAGRLLALVAGLLRESHAAGAPLPEPTLDSLLDQDLGIDSLGRVELLLRLERAFDVRLPAELLAQAATPRDLLRAVLAGTPHAAGTAEPTPIERAAAASPGRADTLLAVLDAHALRTPDRVHVVVLGEDGEREAARLTYGSLRADAHAVAYGLAREGVGAGDTVALMLPTGRDFFRAFLGILMAGAVPVPIYPPASLAGLAVHLRRQSRILASCEARLLVTVPEARPAARMLQALVPTLKRIATAGELASPVPQALPRRAGNDIALLQYTSGSTGDPKGVVLTHANLLANLRAMGQAVAPTAEDTFVSWLPLYHDMGLIGAWFGAMRFAFPLVVMPPTAFVNRPSRWLRAIHRYRGTISAAPNFAYEICAARLDERDLAGLDLSCWRLALDGAEAVGAETLERFAARFAPHGLRREALMPVYGLAECAVGLAFPPPGRGPRIDRVDRAALARGEAREAAPGDAQALRFPSCGTPLPGHELRIVAPDGREAPERVEGRIEFRGPSATTGYYRNPARSRELFHDDWLESGDLGYMAGGELHVTGRVKDLIIRGGQHLHPQEIEEAASAVAGVRRGCVAAFGMPDAATGSERLVVLAETRLSDAPSLARLRADVSAAVAALGTPPDEVALVPPHTVPKTSSGKIRRLASREVYRTGATRGSRLVAWEAAAGFAGSLVAGRLRRAVSALGRGAYRAWLAIAAIPLVIVAAAVALLPDSTLRWRALRALARALLRASALPLSVSGLEHIPAEGPVVIVANHASYLDGPLLFALLPRPATFVTKRELASRPLFARILRVAGVAWVERFDIERGAADARHLAGLARQGTPLVFFPEGTFTRAPGLLPFHMGAFVAAAEAGVPLVPVALRGVRSVLRDGQWRPRRVPLAVEACAPIVADGTDWAAAARLREASRRALLARCGEPDAAPYRAENAASGVTAS